MNIREIQKERNAQYEERHALAVGRLRGIVSEETVPEQYLPYFQDVAIFLLELENVRRKVENGEWERYSIEEMKSLNEILYSDVLEEHYGRSYANPTYAADKYGLEMGRLLSMLYAEMRSGIPYSFENRMDYLTILYELFIEVYNSFENTEQEKTQGIQEDTSSDVRTVRDILYWYASDYCDVFLTDRIMEQIDPTYSPFAADIIESADLDNDRYLYSFGEFITANELGTARHLRTLPKETLKKMADVYTEGYRIGFINTGKDLSKKSVVNIRYSLGFEKVIRIAIENFRKMGLEPVIYRAASGIITKREHHKIGYYGAVANWQYEYDHRQDQALIMDKRYIERRLEVLKTVYEQHREQAAQFAGPAVMETFGEKPFSPKAVPEASAYNDEQKKMAVSYDSRSGQITNEYIRGEERSFTIVAYPVPEIGENYPEIFNEVIRINTLDAKLYEKVQQTMIDALDQGQYVCVKGRGENRTDIRVALHHLEDPQKETVFENCVADVNIPVGEVFTSPVLEGTSGILHVSRVYLEGLQYTDLELTFKDGMITDYRCGNFDDPEEGRRYIADNVLKGHDSLPLGEFAIGTNTTAYVVGKEYGIEDKMPILIAEKTGPHFAVGDTCYSWSEDIRVYNPNGKEIIAKDNSVSINRKEDVSKAYFNCHTDITIPYEELEEISVVTKEGKHIILLKDGRFVLPGTEVLNEPLEK
ncbi:aminopeptidase [Mediterraneibacter glycyrrhizinilyticus]|uniref:aminopeptidase n=1 Tax=Mediterraneibacter glycyrrhizinilyticus TaxID=342942 RepID=UPI0025AA5552|nr:aminopeptidase [Mediterraneibacter glycyrrhizinilyticus]MDN0059929.1 aminopeptidase [Mediterraneibacter glycyrrhizinilyticus]